MGTLERTETLVHRIGTNGRVTVKTLSGRLRVRGVDGEDVRLEAKYRIRAADQFSAERALETGRLLVDRGPGSLEVESPDRRLATGLAWLFSGARVNADVTLEVPWGTRVRLETMSGSIEAASLVGDQKYRTVSGEVILWSLGGLVEAGSISGGITLDSGGDIRIRATSISGSVRLRARRFYGMSLSSTSGSISIVGSFDPSGDYHADSISGSVRVTPLSDLTVELRTISGSIASDIHNRIEGSRGFWRSTIGTGQSRLRVNSTSGGVHIVAPRPGDSVPASPGPSPSAASGSWAPESSTSTSTSTSTSPSTDGATASAEGTPQVANPPAGEGTPSPSNGVISEESWRAEDAPETPESRQPSQTPGTAESEQAPEDQLLVDDEELAILQALERGEITVEEAALRLDRARRIGHGR